MLEVGVRARRVRVGGGNGEFLVVGREECGGLGAGSGSSLAMLIM